MNNAGPEEAPRGTGSLGPACNLARKTPLTVCLERLPVSFEMQGVDQLGEPMEVPRGR
jgi:hypothetical protein